MLESTHRRLAQEISKALNLNQKQSKLLEEGSVIHDYQENFPHQIGKQRAIENLLHKARRIFLKKDDDCYYLLGMAFNFIENKWTLSVMSRDMRADWEKLIDEQAILSLENFQTHLQNAPIPSKFKDAYLRFIEIITHEIERPDFWEQIADSSRGRVYGESSDKMTKETNDKEACRIGSKDSNGFGNRVVFLATDTWQVSKQDVLESNILVFKEALRSSANVRHTSPTIDLNMSYITCLEIGKRTLSEEFFWTED
jgi:hypothetical protein